MNGCWYLDLPPHSLPLSPLTSASEPSGLSSAWDRLGPPGSLEQRP